jgi:DNA-binding transcriptional LysR family regulator
MNRAELDGLSTFLAVAEQNGFRAAARYLGVTPSAVSQSIQALERRIGAPLFSRTTRSVGLTEAGQQLLAHARPAADMFEAGLQAARDLGDQPSGQLRINTTRSIVPLLINRLLPDFHEAYPNIRLELIGEDKFIDIVDEGFDAGIRLGHVIELDMVTSWLTPPDRYVVVGAPHLFDKYGRPRNPEDLQRLPAILVRRNGRVSQNWKFSKNGHILNVEVSGPLIVDDSETSIRAALRGVGIAYTVNSLVAADLQQGSLEAVLKVYGREIPGWSLYYPSRSQSLPKLRAFADFAVRRLREGLAPDDFVFRR